MIKKENLKENIFLYKRDEIILSDTSKLIQGDLNGITMHMNLGGERTLYDSLISDHKVSLKKNYTLIDMMNKEEGILSEKKNTHIQYINIAIKRDFLEQNLPQNKITDKFLNFFESDKNVQNISHKRTNPKTQILALEIFNNQYTNNLEKLFLESKVLELIYTEFTDLFQNNDMKYKRKIHLSSQDKESVYEARDILINNIANPPTIRELAKLVAINELKIKAGFHKYFNETPYNMLLEYRLQKAKKLLDSSELNISEISQQVGYKFSQNFTKAFIKRFGVRPKDLMKKRKYYY